MRKPKTKRFVALARVSSREQEREGFSLDVQESALRGFADRAGGQIDRTTWDRVQVLLGEKVYRSYELTYSGGLMHCAHCGSAITGESKSKPTKHGEAEYVYYRCTMYNKPGHPRFRWSERNLDRARLGLFDQLLIKDEEASDYFTKLLREFVNGRQTDATEKINDLRRQVDAVRKQENELLNLRLLGEIESATFLAKKTELRESGGPPQPANRSLRSWNARGQRSGAEGF